MHSREHCAEGALPSLWQYVTCLEQSTWSWHCYAVCCMSDRCRDRGDGDHVKSAVVARTNTPPPPLSLLLMLVKDGQGISPPLRLLSGVMLSHVRSEWRRWTGLIWCRLQPRSSPARVPLLVGRTYDVWGGGELLSIWTLYWTWWRQQKPIETVHITAVTIKGAQ